MAHNSCSCVCRPMPSGAEGRREEKRGRAEIERLIAKHQNLVCLNARRFFPSKSQDQDLLQCGLIGLWEAAQNWCGDGKFETYAGRSILNNMKDYLRGEQRAPLTGQQNAQEPAVEYEEEIINRLDTTARIESAWTENSRERYVLIALSKGVSRHSIAAALGVELHTVSRIIRKAAAGLKVP